MAARNRKLANGGYEALATEQQNDKLKADFAAFMRRRVELLINAVRCLAAGRQLSVADICGD